MVQESKLRIDPIIALLLLAGGAYGARRLLAYVGKSRVKKAAYNSLSPRKHAKILKSVRKRSHPWVTKSYGSVYIKSA